MAEQRIHVGLLDEPLIVVRENIETPEFRELVADIAVRGLEVMVIVRHVGDRYRVVDGYRRWLAAQRAGLSEIRCDVRELTDEQELQLLMRVGLHRADFTPLEEGRMFAAMEEGLGLKPAAIAQDLGVTVGRVVSRIELVRSPAEIQEAVRDKRISMSVGLELLRCPHPEDRKFLLHHATHGGCTTELMRAWVQKAAADRAALPAGADPTAPVVTVEARPQLLGVCNVHEGEVPIELLLTQRICADCWRAIMAATAPARAQTTTTEEVSHDGHST